MIQKGNGRQEYFYINFTKLEPLMKKKNVSASQLSDATYHSRGWLYQVKKRNQRVKLVDAEKIAGILGCGIQNFAARTGEGHKRYWDPVIIDYKAEAEERFTSLLLNGKSRELADVLRFMEDSENNINYLIALISPRVQIQRQKRDSESTQIRENVPWIRMLYVSAFARALAKKLTVPDQDIADAFAIKKEEIEERSKSAEDKLEEKINNKMGIIKSVEQSEKCKQKAQKEIEGLKTKLSIHKTEVRKEKVNAIRDIVKNKFGDKVDDIENSKEFSETILNECGEFLYLLFTSRATDLSIDAQINLYKNGELF